MKRPRIAISIGDPNGIGLEIALASHDVISQWCAPFYVVDDATVLAASARLNRSIPDAFTTIPLNADITIQPGVVCADAGAYSYRSFQTAIKLAEDADVDAIVTLPIHKEAWMKAGITFKGHTDMLRHHFKQDAIMMLGCERLYVALFTEHIPLHDVARHVKTDKLTDFLITFYSEVRADSIAVLGLNPHAGDNGVLGDEERIIEAAIEAANDQIDAKPFIGPVVPDIAFTPGFGRYYRHVVAMYHDQGLTPLKALYFDESINVSLNLPIIRTSVDHGTAFDIAYQGIAKNVSYLNAVKAAIEMVHVRMRR